LVVLQKARPEITVAFDSRPVQNLGVELMLQQTQVVRVLPKYREWLARFPSFKALAEAPLVEVLQLWQGWATIAEHSTCTQQLK